MNPGPADDDWSPEPSASSGRSWLVPLIIAALTVLVLWGVAIGWLLIPYEPSARESMVTSPPPIAPTGEEALIQATEAWDQFVEAEGFDQRRALVLDPERVEPLMRDYHEARGHPWPSMNSRSAPKEIRRNQQPVVVFEVEGFSGHRYPVAMAWDGRKFVVDWESLTAYGTIEWTQLLESPPANPQVLRVYLGRLPERLQPPASVAQGRTFVRMEHRDSPATTTLAVPPRLALEVLRETENRRVPFTLDVVWNQDLGACELRRIVARGWNSPT